MSDQFVFITPIQNLEMPLSRYKLIQIGNVYFVSYDKINYYKKKFGLRTNLTTMPYLIKTENTFFTNAQAFALIHHSGDTKNKGYEYIIKVQNAIDILCLLERGFSKRRFSSIPCIWGMPIVKSYKYLFVNKKNPSVSSGWRLIGTHNSLILSNEMISYHKQGYFFKLLDILNKKKNIISVEWYKCIFDASVLLGKSWAEKSVPEAFLYNMIALETLLTESGDAFSLIIPKRIKSFIGWVGYWETENFESKIDEMYKKRCKIVHEGKLSLVLVDDLLFIDDLVNNVFDNIINHINLFHCKKDLILFTKKIEAEHLLGIQGKTRPKTLRFSHKTYSEKDKLEII